jgi:hypothetical protein
VDLVQCAGYKGDAAALNGDVEAAVRVLAAAFAKWGVMPTLDFVRGGRTGEFAEVWHVCRHTCVVPRCR